MKTFITALQRSQNLQDPTVPKEGQGIQPQHRVLPSAMTKRSKTPARCAADEETMLLSFWQRSQRTTTTVSDSRFGRSRLRVPARRTRPALPGRPGPGEQGAGRGPVPTAARAQLRTSLPSEGGLALGLPCSYRPQPLTQAASEVLTPQSISKPSQPLKNGLQLASFCIRFRAG